MNIEYRSNMRKANKSKSSQIFSIKKVKNQKKWTKEEDELLVALAEKYHEKHWKEISKKFFKKNSLQCFSRYKRIRPGIIKGSWKKDEDLRIIDLVTKHGKSWSKISKIIGTRNGKQIRDRYINVLDPEIKKGKFTEEEDRKLILLFKQNGPKWATIAKYYPNRTADMIKNRFHSSIKKKLNLEGIPESKLFSKEFRDEIYASTKFESPLDDPTKHLCITSTISSTFNKFPSSNIMNNNFNFTINPSNKTQADENQILENLNIASSSQTSNLNNTNTINYLNNITESGKENANPNIPTSNNNYLIDLNNLSPNNYTMNKNLNYLHPNYTAENQKQNQDWSVNNNINLNNLNLTNNNYQQANSANSQGINSYSINTNGNNNYNDHQNLNAASEKNSNTSNRNLNLQLKHDDIESHNKHINQEQVINQSNSMQFNKEQGNNHRNSNRNSTNSVLVNKKESHSKKNVHSHKKQKNFDMEIDGDEDKNMNSTITSKDSDPNGSPSKKKEGEKDDFNYDILNLDMEINGEDSAYSNGNYIWNFEDYFTI